MRRRLLNLVTALSLLVCAASLALWVVSYVAGTRNVPLVPSTAAVQAGLAEQSPVSNASAPGVALDDFILYLERASRVPVFVNWDALGEAGIAYSGPVNVSLGNAHVGEAFAAVLKACDGAVFVTRGDGIYITTRAALDADPRSGPAVITRSPVLPPDPRLREVIIGGQRWTFAADRGVLKAWCDPADPAAAYQPPRAAGAPSEGGSVALGDFMVGRFGYPLYSWQASVPFWAIALMGGVVPVVRLRRWARRRRARRAGLCANCGYDLRATPGRCPECGGAPERVGRRSTGPADGAPGLQ